MGHYDNCRPENCSICGQALGHCEHTEKKSKKPKTKVKLWPLTKEETSMFRGTKRSELSRENFSVGSFIGEGNNPKKWLVVSCGNYVQLLRMKDFDLLGASVTVEDPNFLSKEETRNLIKVLPGTFTDYDFDPQGLK
jgi:hypothetical protein